MSSRRARGPARPRPERGPSVAGQEYDVEVGPIAHGGHCVARLPADLPDVGGTVVFVRHALPGERVTVRLTEGTVGDRFLRGDAIRVLVASPDRVEAPCPVAGPGGCGGCDFQHVSLDAQRRLKAAVVAEQLRRLAGVELPVEVEAVPGDVDGLRWRTRMRFVEDDHGTRGLRAHRSHVVVPVADCLLEAPGAWEVVEGREDTSVVEEVVRGHRFAVDTAGFWQVHRGAPEALVGAVLEGAGVRPGDRVVDLYSGVGLFTVFLAEAAGDRGRVQAVEGVGRAAEHAARNLAAYPWVETFAGPVERLLEDPRIESCDVVVLDPPRQGARQRVVRGIADLGPRTVVYVACDPGALARDTAYFAEEGYRLDRLRAFDLFPMTSHVEVVALLSKADEPWRTS